MSDTIKAIDPIPLLPSVLGDFVKDISYRLQCAPDAAIVAALCETGAMLGKAIHIQMKHNDPSWKERPALWGAFIGHPASMKTPSSREALSPIMNVQQEYHFEYQQQLGQEGRNSTPRLKTCLLHEDTGESLYKVMSPRFNEDSKGALFFRDELSGWYYGIDKYRPGKGDDRQLWLQCHSGGPHLFLQI